MIGALKQDMLLAMAVENEYEETMATRRAAALGWCMWQHCAMPIHVVNNNKRYRSCNAHSVGRPTHPIGNATMGIVPNQASCKSLSVSPLVSPCIPRLTWRTWLMVSHPLHVQPQFSVHQNTSCLYTLTLSQNETLEMSSMAMSWGFIMIFHMEVACRTSMPADHNGWPMSGSSNVGQLLLMWCKVLAKVTPKCFFIRKWVHWWAFATYCYEINSHDHSIQPSWTLHAPFCHSCHRPTHCDAQTQNTYSHCSSYNIQSCPWRCANPCPSTFCMTQHDPLEDSHPIPYKP